MVDSKWTRQWPELFAGLPEEQAEAIVQSINNGVLEGWQPQYEDVELLTRSAREHLSRDEYLAEVIARAKRATAG